MAESMLEQQEKGVKRGHEEDRKEEDEEDQYPHNKKKTCIMHSLGLGENHAHDNHCGGEVADEATGQFDTNFFIDKDEAEDLLSTLEALAGKLAYDTQPLQLDWAPEVPPPLPLQWQHSLPAEWSQEASEIEGGKKEEDASAQR